MRMSSTGFQSFTRRNFFRTIAGTALATVPGFVVTKSKLLPEDESLVGDYIIVNGWVLSDKDALLRQEQR